MYVKASVIADQPVRQAIAAILEDADAWFPNLVQAVGERSGTHLASVGFRVAGVPLQKRVQVELGTIRHERDWLRVGFSWRPVSAAGMFPSMEGEFHLEPNTFLDTNVTVSGTYDPPLGLAGRSIDAALMHRVAEATVKDLALTIVAELDHRLLVR